eukprot:2970674-Alexandrium_andersonii.AAC.1
MAAPTTTAWAALVRLIRYLVVRPRRVYHLPVAGRRGRSPRIRRRGLRWVSPDPEAHVRGSVRAGHARHQALVHDAEANCSELRRSRAGRHR